MKFPRYFKCVHHTTRRLNASPLNPVGIKRLYRHSDPICTQFIRIVRNTYNPGSEVFHLRQTSVMVLTHYISQTVVHGPPVFRGGFGRKGIAKIVSHI
jgi:hypothetical protein